MSTGSRFSLRAWSAWAPGAVDKASWAEWASGRKTLEGEAKPDVAEVPALLRRRLSLADRMALRAALDCLGDKRGVPTVFCSRHGELHRSEELLTALAKGEGMLPMSFSLSVHNAASGLYGIARADTASSTSVAAGRDTMAMGLMEAWSQLQSGAGEVLVAGYDDRMPKPFAPFADESDQALAVAMLIGRDGGETMELESGTFEVDGEQAFLRLARFLAGGGSAAVLSGSWRLRRVA